MVLTNDEDVMIWGKCYYGFKLDDPIPFDVNGEASSNLGASDEAVNIRDVTTCHVPSGESFIELVVALTSTSNLIFCAGISPGSDCQTMDDCILQIRYKNDKTNLTTLRSAGSVLVGMDQKGEAYYVDIWRWLLGLLSPDLQTLKVPKDLIHAVFSNLKESDVDNLPTVEFTAIAFGVSIMAVEASLHSFLFCSNVGDVYSCCPMAGRDVVHHKELNCEIIVQISCGASHQAALSDSGKLFTCGEGRSGQLGCGTFQSSQTFQLVPLTEFHRVQTVCCGWASTSVLTENGKVCFHFVWQIVVFSLTLQGFIATFKVTKNLDFQSSVLFLGHLLGEEGLKQACQKFPNLSLARLIYVFLCFEWLIVSAIFSDAQNFLLEC